MLKKALLLSLVAPLFATANVAAAKPELSACTLTPASPFTINAGDLQTFSIFTSGCSTTERIARFRVADGKLPDGMEPSPRARARPASLDAPRPRVYEVTLQVRDETGTKDTEQYQIIVEAPLPLVTTNQSDVLSPGTVGEDYCCGNLFASGGVLPSTWSLRRRRAPPGLELSESPGRITGLPTTAGTFTFTVRVTDDRGAPAERSFSITISEQ